MVSQQFFHVRIDFKTKKENIVRSSILKDKYNKISNICFLKQRE